MIYRAMKSKDKVHYQYYSNVQSYIVLITMICVHIPVCHVFETTYPNGNRPLADSFRFIANKLGHILGEGVSLYGEVQVEQV